MPNIPQETVELARPHTGKPSAKVGRKPPATRDEEPDMTTQTQTEYALEIALETFRNIVAGPLFERAMAGLPLPSVAEFGSMEGQRGRMYEQAQRCYPAIVAIRHAQAAMADLKIVEV